MVSLVGPSIVHVLLPLVLVVVACHVVVAIACHVVASARLDMSVVGTGADVVVASYLVVATRHDEVLALLSLRGDILWVVRDAFHSLIRFNNFYCV